MTLARTLRSTWPLLIGIALIMLGNGLQGSLLGLRAVEVGFSTATTGVVMTSYYVGILAGSVMMPGLVAKVGHIRVFAALAATAASAVLLHVLLVDPWAWGALRVVTGVAYAGLYIVAESWLNNRADNDNRGQILAIYMVISLGGLGFGQLMLPLGDAGEATLFILVSVMVSMALVPIALTSTVQPPFAAPSHIGMRSLIQASPLGVTGCFTVGVVNGAVFGMGVVYALGAGMTIGQASVFMFAALAGGVALQWPLGRLSDRFSRRKIITALSAVSAAFSLLGVVLAGQPAWVLMTVICLYGGVSLPLYSICVAYTNDYLETDQMVAASGSLVLVRGVGSALGPVTAALLMAQAGPSGFFWCLALAHAAVGLLALYRMTRRAAKRVEEQRRYAAAGPRETPIAAAARAQSAKERR